MSKTKFPGPYIDECRVDDSIMVRVNIDKMEIGARSSGLPKDIKSSNGTISHVGNSAD